MKYLAFTIMFFIGNTQSYENPDPNFKTWIKNQLLSSDSIPRSFVVDKDPSIDIIHFTKVIPNKFNINYTAEVLCEYEDLGVWNCSFNKSVIEGCALKSIEIFTGQISFTKLQTLSKSNLTFIGSYKGHMLKIESSDGEINPDNGSFWIKVLGKWTKLFELNQNGNKQPCIE